MIRRTSLERGAASIADLSAALDRIGVRPGRRFRVEAELSSMDIDCTVCGRPVGTDGWSEVGGFRRREGTPLVAQEPTGRLACNRCVSRMVAGDDALQDDMLGDAA